MSLIAHRGLLLANGGGVSDPYWGSVTALLHMDGVNGSTTFTDATGRSWIANGFGEKIATDKFQFGGAAGQFETVPGTGTENGSRIQTADAANLRFGTADFTVEGWFLAQAPLLGNGFVFRKGQNTTDGLTLGITPTLLTLRAAGTTDTTAAVSLSTTLFSHIAFVRDSGTVRFYVNGVQVGSQARSFTHSSTDTCYVGSVAGDTRFAYKGRIDDFRITTGVCRYPGGTSFTPPSSAFPNF